MDTLFKKSILIFIFFISFFSCFAQDIKPITITGGQLDSLMFDPGSGNLDDDTARIDFSAGDALIFLRKTIETAYWKDTTDLLKESLSRLVYEASNPPFDSTLFYLKNYPFDSISVLWKEYGVPRAITGEEVLNDSVAVPAVVAGDSTLVNVVDSLAFSGDSLFFTKADTLPEMSSEKSVFPLDYYDNPCFIDSIRAAVESLLGLIDKRDSTLVLFTGRGDEVIPVWLNSQSEKMQRYWLRSDMNDSVTVWIGGHSKDTIGLYLESGIRLLRPVRHEMRSDIKVEMQEVDRSSLLEVRKIIVKPELWKYRTETSFALNQTALSNWVKGGESSVSTTLDITGFADYENKLLKLNSANFARLKYGLIATTENGVRKNLDLFETNSKINHKAFGKFDFSGIMLFKTQISKGHTYTDSSKNMVSRFMNPATLTLGFGLDYKPGKKTSINFSPLSYKATFVPDTSRIDQTLYGVAADRRAKHEPGMSFMITNEYKPSESLTVTNRLQLFTNYRHNPQNIDIDWEMILTARINWFTELRLNTHFIFDDDTKTPEYDKDDKPVLGPDNKPKKTARIQFKELLGFSFVFRF